MFTTLIALTSVIAVASSPAGAADLGGDYRGSLKDEPIYAPAFTWTGVYLGVHGGYAWNDVAGVFDSADVNPINLNRLDLSSALLGGQIGAQYQFGNFVVGVEGDASVLLNDDSFRYNFDLAPSGFSFEAGTNYLASIRGRLGYAIDRFHFYGTAGWAKAEYEISTNVSPVVVPGTGSSKFTQDGAVYGGGIEYAIGDGAILRAEYLHYDVGTNRAITNLPHIDADAGDNIKIRDLDVVRVGLSIKFN